MLAHLSKPLLVVAALILASVCHAELPGKVALESAEMAAELIGAPVFAADGVEVGEVANISFDDEGQPHRLRIATGKVLGLGARTLAIPQAIFTALRGAVVLAVPADAVEPRSREVAAIARALGTAVEVGDADHEPKANHRTRGPLDAT